MDYFNGTFMALIIGAHQPQVPLTFILCKGADNN